MATWREVAAAVPDLAGDVRARFDATGLGMLATVRKDGSPRISGIEPKFTDSVLWFGSMDDARKLDDLRRDPRMALHAATIDKEVKEGDAKVTGRAVLVEDDAEFDALVTALREVHGDQVPEGRFPLFTVDVTGISLLRPAGDHLDIRWWTESGGAKQVDRY
jgi:nitroimidazol reductase NimA-like FMN-containing flavoprotein (pyridoxamine 5'-phosphate oxidase superfamily)